MRTLPRRISAALPPDVTIIGIVAQPVAATVVVVPAAHAGLGTGVAWCVGSGFSCRSPRCDITAVGIVAICRRRDNQVEEESNKGGGRDDNGLHVGLRESDVA